MSFVSAIAEKANSQQLAAVSPQCNTAVCRTTPVSELTDAELERHIKSCGELMLSAYARYEASGCFSDRGEADRWRILRDEAIRSRSDVAVARIEARLRIA